MDKQTLNLDDLKRLAPNIRPVDRIEASHIFPGEDFETLLTQSAENAKEAWIFKLSGTPVAVCGVSESDAHDTGYAWMVAANAVELQPKGFYACCREAWAEMHFHFPKLTNFVWAQNKKSITLVEHLGGEFNRFQPITTKSGELFYQFWSKV